MAKCMQLENVSILGNVHGGKFCICSEVMYLSAKGYVCQVYLLIRSDANQKQRTGIFGQSRHKS